VGEPRPAGGEATGAGGTFSVAPTLAAFNLCGRTKENPSGGAPWSTPPGRFPFPATVKKPQQKNTVFVSGKCN